MKKKGKRTYLPPCLVEEIESIMQAKNYSRPAQAKVKLVEYARVGREAETLLDYMTFRNRKKGGRPG